MNDLTPRLPRSRPLIWPDAILDIQETLLEMDTPPVYIVGGAVRDAFLHRPVKDLDLATSGDAIRLAKQLANRLHGNIFVMDRERDVARVFLDTPEGKLVIDVAGFRGADLQADLTGRDFTLNAMAVDFRGDMHRLIDPLNGEQDTENKLLRRCAPDAIATDPIRALRAVRQSVQLTLTIEPETLKDIRAASHRLMETSPERVRDEFMHLLTLDRVAPALRVADTVGLLQYVVPEMMPLHGLAQPAPHVYDAWQHTLMTIEKLAAILAAMSYRRTDSTAAAFDLGMLVIQCDRYRRPLNQHLEEKWANERPHRALMMLAALLHNTGKGATQPPEFTGYATKSVKLAGARADALRLSTPEKKRLLTMIGRYRAILDKTEWPPLEQHRFWYQTGEAGPDICLLALADYLATFGNELSQHDWLTLVDRVRALLAARYDFYAQIVRPVPLVNGSDLMEKLDIPAGPLIGKLLDMIREAQVTGEVATIHEAVALARRHIKGEGHGVPCSVNRTIHLKPPA